MSVNLVDLWIPILLGGALAWIASGVIHTVLKYHNSDYGKLSNEDDVAASLRTGSVEPGFYSLPHCVDMKAMNEEAMQNRFKEGPVAFIAIFPKGVPPMGKLLGQQIVYFVISGVMIAYCATLALAPGADYMSVFRVVSAVGFLAFCWSNIPMSIWYGHPWSTTFKYIIDALVYALVMAGTFAWLWPAAVG